MAVVISGILQPVHRFPLASSLKSFRSEQQGNVLFLILIAVVLFAALSYAVSMSTRNNQKDAGAEKIQVTAAALIQYATSVENAITRLRAANMCPDTDISFATPIYETLGGGEANPESKFSPDPPQRRCHVFDANGGQAIAISFKEAAIQGQVAGPLKSGHATLIIGSVPDIGSAAPELILAFPSIRKDVCLDAQRRIGATTATAPVGNCPWTEFEGNYSTSPACDAGTAGLRTWCGNDAANTGATNFYQVVIPR